MDELVRMVAFVLYFHLYLLLSLGQCPFPDWYSELLQFRYYRCYMIEYWHYNSRMLKRLASILSLTFLKNFEVEIVFLPLTKYLS